MAKLRNFRQTAIYILILRALKYLHMRVFKTKRDLQTYIGENSNSDDKIGFVPTMGALHIGHMSLVNKSLENNNLTVVSVFVNPTQFNNSSDLDNYPRSLDDDIILLKKESESIVVFAPNAEDLYSGIPVSNNYDFGGIENEMEGKFRKGHFDGVGTVLKLLFEAVKPTQAYFGEKDFQQLQIVKKLVEIEKIPINIVGCEIYRESNGLAFSSRNERLTTTQRKEGKLLFDVLSKVKQLFGIKSVIELNEMVIQQFENHPLFKLEYFEIATVSDLKTVTEIEKNQKHRAFLAVYADEVRLIDNIALN